MIKHSNILKRQRIKLFGCFKQINILYQNEEYSIVESNTQYGLNVYDYIVLDASTVNEDDIIYE